MQKRTVPESGRRSDMKVLQQEKPTTGKKESRDLTKPKVMFMVIWMALGMAVLSYAFTP